MSQKTRIVDTLGERSLLRPTVINAALAANDRAKYYFTLLQTAVQRALRPDSRAPDLRRERLACGVDNDALDAVVAEAIADPDGRVRIADGGELVRALLGEIGAMLAPITDERESGFKARFEALRLAADALPLGVYLPADIDAMTSANRDRGDSLHLLVMDLHKALNAAQAAIASEDIDGARAYAIDAVDRLLIAAFMRGVHRTSPLKFDHPGLGTTATRNGRRLVIQNDIGTTDAHVLVLHVEGLRASLTYTDVHLPRLLFFQNLFEGRGVEWDDTRSRRDEAMDDGVFHLCVGTFTAGSSRELQEFLAFLGSRLVFLIDWNKARKRLQALVSKGDAIRLLLWAAQNDVGHMGFLKAGGESLVFNALDFVLKGQARFGQQLTQVLDKREATTFLKFVLRTCAESGLRGEPESFAQDAVRAELFNSFRTVQERLYDILADHAALIAEIAGGVRDSLLQVGLASAGKAFQRNAERAKDWESSADDLVNRARGASANSDATEFFRLIVESTDDIADELEDAAFHLTLLPATGSRADAEARLQALSELLVHGTQEYVKLVENARHVRRGGAREDVHDFLAAIHRIQQIEHDTDEAQRGIKRAVLSGVDDARTLFVMTTVARNLEQAADGLMHCGLRIRDHVLGDALAA
jgi:uncharacterized protein Yka (UPF0111/DUF47 family)